MRDRDIRETLRLHLATAHSDISQPPLILDEVEICAGEVRADVMVVNGVLAGYEIKSEKDTLARLAAQSAAYNRVFDRVSLVASSNHVENAMKMLPDWWGIIRVTLDGKVVELESVRAQQDNPAIDPYAVGMLLWRHEALRLLEAFGIDRGCRTKPVNCMVSRLCEHLPPAQVSGCVRATIKARGDWRSGRVAGAMGGSVQLDSEERRNEQCQIGIVASGRDRGHGGVSHCGCVSNCCRCAPREQ